MNTTAVVLSGMVSLGMAVPAAQTRQAIELEAADCSRVRMTFGEEVVARAVGYATVPLSSAVLDIQPDGNGGIQIERGAGRNYAITACIGAGGATAAEARQFADAIRLAVDGGRVRVEGPAAAGNWSVHLIVEAPDNARIRVESSNGPIGITGVSGDITARSSNGPLRIEDVSGTVNARALNGPLGIVGSRGNFDVQTDNGPMSVSLTGTRWDGRLDARANNGPLEVTVRDDYRSGVEIRSSGHSPWRCNVDACRSASREGNDSGRTLQLGNDPVVVRISTSNGPVSVQRR